jgi:hypothetical protein
MPRDRDEPAAVRVYTVCDESRYTVVLVLLSGPGLP